MGHAKASEGSLNQKVDTLIQAQGTSEHNGSLLGVRFLRHSVSEMLMSARHCINQKYITD